MRKASFEVTLLFAHRNNQKFSLISSYLKRLNRYLRSLGGARTALLASISTVATPTRKVLAKSFLFFENCSI
nr:MAG TPA: hypothetical protein [Caudoviricetes sp.]DAR28736.1 MAG TPA: hypothetical protein [Herelleviridae sp.]